MAVHLKIGSHVGKYRILEELGEGPISHVFLADDTVLYRQVALKVLKPEFAREPAGQADEEEMNSAAVLLHSGIVPLYGTGADSGFHYYSMGLMPGGNLRGVMNAGMTSQQALTVISQIARALAFAHGKGINHQGIKPENVLFRKDGSAVLSDFHVVKVHGFGIGVLAKDPEPHPYYISPEHIQNAGKQFGRGDLYSLGVLLFEMLTGQVPYQGENVHWQHINSPVPKLPPAMADLQPLLDQLLAKRPAERFADVNQLIKAVDQLTSRKGAEKGSKVTILPFSGGKSRGSESERGDRPFIEGQQRSASPEQERAMSYPVVDDKALDFQDESLPAIPLSMTSAPSAEPHPPGEADVAGAFPGVESQPRETVLPKKRPSSPGPREQRSPRPKTAPQKANRANPAPRRNRKARSRRKLLLSLAVLAALAGAGAIWWSMDRPSAPNAPMTASSPEQLPGGGETKTGAPALSPAEKELQDEFARAVAYSRTGQRAEAAALFQQMTAQFPLAPEPYNNLAAIQASLGDLDASQSTLEQALRVHPSYAVLYENLNTVQLEKALGQGYRDGLGLPGEKAAPPRLQFIEEIGTPAQAAQVALPPPSKAPPATNPGSPSVSSDAPAASGETEAIRTLTAWAQAWSAQDFPRYLTFYGPDFAPPGDMTREGWEKVRHRNITTPARIDVRLDEIHVTPVDKDRLRVIAVQEYRSDRYRDRTLKGFDLGLEDGTWIILAEENLGELR